MSVVLGIDTSNYTTSIAVIEDGKCTVDLRKLLTTKQGERGLRQSEALFQHINNLPTLLRSTHGLRPDCIAVSSRPRPVEGSYMPVFKAGESIAESLSSVFGTKLVHTTHQEGHIEAACRSIGFLKEQFICFHLSGGTTEVLHVQKALSYKIDIVGKTLDISAGQLVDRIGVAMGLDFPCGEKLDQMAMKVLNNSGNTNDMLVIPSCVNGMNMNFSGQETKGLKWLQDGHNQDEIAFSVMKCISKTLEKVITNVFREYRLPILFTGGVAGSRFLKTMLSKEFGSKVWFSDARYSSDNAVGVAYIGHEQIGRS